MTGSPATPSPIDALYQSCVMRNYAPAPFALVRGRGSRVWDDAGREYLDFCTGIAVNSVGHGHPLWVRRVQEQAATLVHVSNLFRNENQALLARKLCELAGPGRVFFCNSGTEANEALIKLARLHGRKLSGGQEGKRYKVLCAKNAFHGRTFGGMSATPQEKIQNGFRPMLDGFAFGEFNNVDSFAALADDTTAAILIETIQGESGVTPATAEFLRGLRKLCDERNLLLMLDEVQCGVGRTGRFYAYEHHGVKPDAIGMAKGLGGGFPVGAVWASAPDTCDLFTPGTHGSTFGGTPLACAAALAVLEIIEQEGLMLRVAQQSGPWHERLRTIAQKFPNLIKEVRGPGYMVGIVFKVDHLPIVAALRANGLLTAPAGNQVIRLLPPLTATSDELAEAASKLEATLAALPAS